MISEEEEDEEEEEVILKGRVGGDRLGFCVEREHSLREVMSRSSF